MKRYGTIGVALGAVIVVVVLFALNAQRAPKPPFPAPEVSKTDATGRINEVARDSATTAKVKKHALPAASEGKTQVRAPKGDHDTLGALVRTLAVPQLSKAERNRIEHLLGSRQDKAIDKKIMMMIRDGLLDLSEGDEEGRERLMSAVRIAGLRSDEKSVMPIINVCTHPEADEEVRMAGYEALGYIEGNEARGFLQRELSMDHDAFVRSQIVLSLGIAGDTQSARPFLSYLDSPDQDLRDSAIIALGKIREARAVKEFKRIYDNTTESSRVLVVQALKDIGSNEAKALLKDIAKKNKI